MRKYKLLRLSRFSGFGAIAMVVSFFIPAAMAFADTTYTISGTLYDGANNPVPNAQLFLAGDEDIQTSTDSNGHYSVDVPPEIYSVDPDFSVEGTNSLPDRVSLRGSSRTLDATASNVSQDLRLDTATITVTLVDHNSNPVSGSEVSIRSKSGSTTFLDGNNLSYSQWSSGNGVSSSSTTNGSGVAILAGLKGMTYEACTYISGGYKVCAPADISLTSNTSATITLPEMHHISGTLYDSANNPIPNAEISASTPELGDSLSDTTDNSGHYSIEVPPDEYNMNLLSMYNNGSLVAPDSVSMSNTDTTVDATTSNATQDLRLDTVQVTVTAKYDNGDPMQNVSVGLGATGGGSTTLLDGNSTAAYYPNSANSVSAGGKTDSSGHATLTVLKGLAYKACATSSGSYGTCNSTTITPTSNGTIDVQFPELHRFYGTVYGHNSQPLAHTRFWLTNNGTPGDMSFETDANGDFSADIPPEVYGLRQVTYSGLGTDPISNIELNNTNYTIDVTSGDVQKDLELDTATVTATVKNSSNIPVTNTSVWLESTGDGSTTLISGENEPYTSSNGATLSFDTTNVSGEGTVIALKGLGYRVCAYNSATSSNYCSPTTITPTSNTTTTLTFP